MGWATVWANLSKTQLVIMSFSELTEFKAKMSTDIENENIEST
jgi:hypothetical protein